MAFRGYVDEWVGETKGTHDNGKIGEELIKLCCYRNPSMALSFLSGLHNRFNESDISDIVNHCNEHKGGISPLISACERCPSVHVVEQLLSYGANPQQADTENRTPIYYTFMRILSRPVVPSESCLPQLRLSIAAAKQIMHMLLEYGCSPTCYDMYFVWNALLQHATISNEIRSLVMLELFPLLFELDLISPNAEHMQCSILSLFSSQGCVSIVHDLLSKGADLYWCHCETEDNVLHYAAKRPANSFVIQSILDHCGSVEDKKSLMSQTNKLGWTVAHFAAQQSSPENLHCLFSFNPDLLFNNDNNGFTVIQYTLSCASLSEVRNLLAQLLARHTLCRQDDFSVNDAISNVDCTLIYSFQLFSNRIYNDNWKEQLSIAQFTFECFLYCHNQFAINSESSASIDITNWSFIDLNRVSNISHSNDSSFKIDAEKWANLLYCWLIVFSDKLFQCGNDDLLQTNELFISLLQHCQRVLCMEYHIPIGQFLGDKGAAMGNSSRDNCAYCCPIT